MKSSTWLHILLLYLLIVYTNLLSAQEIYWRPTNGPAGGTIKTLSSNGKYVFASLTSNGNIYRSADYGISWKLINPSLNPLSSAVINDSQLYALTSYHNLALSTDFGETWQKKPFIFPNNPQLTRLWSYDDLLYIGTVDGFYFSEDDGDNWAGPVLHDQIIEEILHVNDLRIFGTSKGVYVSDGNSDGYVFSDVGCITALVAFRSILYAGNSRGELFASYDKGLNWEAISYISGGFIFSLTATDSLLIAGTQVGIKYSADSGKTWIDTDDNSEYVYDLLTIDSFVLAGTRYDGLRISNNGGKSWIQGNIYSMNIESLNSLNSVLLASQKYSGIIYRSADCGKTWTNHKLNTPFIFDFEEGDNIFFTGARNGVYVSYDDGLTWQINGSQLYDKNVFSVAYHNETLYAGIGGGGIYISHDLGSTWVRGTGISDEYVYDILATNNGIVAAATNGVYLSKDSGINWENIAPPGGAFNLGLLDSTIFVSGYFDGYKIITSEDWGNTWTEETQGFEEDTFYYREFLTVDSLIYVGTNHGVFFSSLNNKMWKPLNNGLNDGKENISALAADDINIYAGSIKNGISWRPFETTFWELSNHSITFSDVLIGDVKQDEIYLQNVGEKDLIVENIFTTYPDFSAEIDKYLIEPGNDAIIKLNYNPKQLGEQIAYLILETNGFYFADSVTLYGLPCNKQNISTIGGLPNNYFLNQNYPNPFNPETTINFGLKKAGNTTINVYNVEGSKIEEIVNQNIPEGNYKITWNPKNIASGLYFLSMRSDNFYKTIRMIYLK
jgi:photosystem II stability/assembly factor-like uncharacterized protein